MAKDGLTELEGVVLSEIDRLGQCTAHEIRTIFATSPSVEWGNSKGAIYPAITRLVERGLVTSKVKADDARGTRQLTLSVQGSLALAHWSSDDVRALGPGTDPFRSRAAHWLSMSPEEWGKLRSLLISQVDQRIAALKARLKDETDHDRIRVELDLALQQARRDWLNANP